MALLAVRIYLLLRLHIILSVVTSTVPRALHVARVDQFRDFSIGDYHEYLLSKLTGIPLQIDNFLICERALNVRNVIRQACSRRLYRGTLQASEVLHSHSLIR